MQWARVLYFQVSIALNDGMKTTPLSRKRMHFILDVNKCLREHKIKCYTIYILLIQDDKMHVHHDVKENGYKCHFTMFLYSDCIH